MIKPNLFLFISYWFRWFSALAPLWDRFQDLAASLKPFLFLFMSYWFRWFPALAPLGIDSGICQASFGSQETCRMWKRLPASLPGNPTFPSGDLPGLRCFCIVINTSLSLNKVLSNNKVNPITFSWFGVKNDSHIHIHILCTYIYLTWTRAGTGPGPGARPGAENTRSFRLV